jgi:FkbM family methyltransferase
LLKKTVLFLIAYIDENYHQKKIFNFLKKKYDTSIEIIFDIGAHEGEFLKRAKFYLGYYKKIYSFEPQKEIFKELKKLSNNKNYLIRNHAFSNENGIKYLNINALSSTSTFSKVKNTSIYSKLKNFILYKNISNSFINKEKVKTVKGDYFSKLNKINKIDLLKIDTEGHELHVLMGFKKMLKFKKIHLILIEMHLSQKYENYHYFEIHRFLLKNKFKLIKKFKFPFLTYEDRLYSL